MKKILAAALALVMALSMAACGNTEQPAETTQAPAETTKAQGETTETTAAPVETGRTTTKEQLIVAGKADVGTLAPYADTSVDRCRVTMNIYDTLFVAQSDGSYEPCLATAWEWVDDTHLKVTLREGVKFSNGNAFTADDVLFTLEYAKSEKSAIASTYAAIDLENTVVNSDTEIVIALSAPNSTIMGYLGSTGYTSILDRETCEADYDAMATKPVGTGPYMVDSWTVGDNVTLVKNPNYWGEEPVIDTVIVRAITESTQRTIELQTGGVDMVYDVPVADVDTIKALGNYTVVEESGVTVHNLYFNATEGHALASLNLRKAVALAINKEDIVIGGYEGSAQVATSFASSAAIGYQYATNGGECFPQDVEAAKQALADYLAETGAAQAEITILYDTNAFRTATVQIVAKQLEDIGIKVNLEQYDFGTALNMALDQSGAWDIYLLGNGESSVLLQCGRFDRAQAPFQAYASDELQAIYEEMTITTDEGKLNTLYSEIYDYFLENYVYVPYCEELVFMAHPSNLENFEIYNAVGVFFQDLAFN